MAGQEMQPGDSREIRIRSFDDFELTLGDVMRGERATLGKSLLDVQRDLKIKAEYIAGIEAADLSVFETPGFISGYVRAYARYLGMNPEWVLGRFCDESGFSHVSGLDAQVHTRPRKARAQRAAIAHAGDAILARSPITAAPREGWLHGVQAGAIGAILVLCAVIGGLAYGGWTLLQEIQRVTLAPVETPLTVFGEAGPNATDAAGLGVEPGAPSVADVTRLYRPQALDQPVLTPRDGPIAMLDPAGQGFYADPAAAPRLAVAPPPAPPEPVEAEARTAAQAAPDNESPTANASPRVSAPPPDEVVLFARRPAWVRVRANDGTVLLEKILEPGERYVLPKTDAPPSLRAGNSGSLFFSVGGETYGPAGPGTSVAKGVVLSASALRATYAAADLSEDPELARLAELAHAPADGATADE